MADKGGFRKKRLFLSHEGSRVPPIEITELVTSHIPKGVEGVQHGEIGWVLGVKICWGVDIRTEVNTMNGAQSVWACTKTSTGSWVNDDYSEFHEVVRGIDK